jgi:uncharacterized protein (DUF1697 family)
MSRHVALLRGINVGGNNKIPMAALSAMFTALGHTEVRTYIQSGNVIFRPRLRSPVGTGLDLELEQAILETFKLPIRVVTRTGDELREVLAHNPFPAAEPERLMVVLLRDVPGPDAIARLDPDRSPPDRFVVRGREIYAYCPNTFAKTKLTLDWFERRLGTVGTARNWRTIGVLAEMASS